MLPPDIASQQRDREEILAVPMLEDQALRAQSGQHLVGVAAAEASDRQFPRLLYDVLNRELLVAVV